MTNKDKMRETIAELLTSGKYKLERDGWSYFEVDSPAYNEIFKGIPKDFLEPLVRTHKSDFSLKGSLWKDDVKGAIALGDMQCEARKLTKSQAKDPKPRIPHQSSKRKGKRNLVTVRVTLA